MRLHSNSLPRLVSSFDSFFGDLSYRSDINNIRHLRDRYCNPVCCTFQLCTVG